MANLPFLLSFDLPEISDRLADHGHAGEGIRELAQDLLHPRDLVLVDYADQHCLVLVTVSAPCLNNGRTVMQFRYYTIDDLVRVCGDHFHLERFLAAFEHIVAYACGQETVDHA